MNYVVLPLFLFTFLLHCHFQKPLVSVLQSPESPPTLLEADGTFKLLSKMHASPALPSPLSSFATCSLCSVSIYTKLLLLFRPHSLCYSSIILFHPLHWNLKRQIKHKQQHELGRRLGITVHQAAPCLFIWTRLAEQVF